MHLEDRQFLFIIGAPRSGTTMLQVLLGNHPQVSTTVELTLFNQYIAPWLERWKVEADACAKGRRRGLPVLWNESELIEFLRLFLGKAYASVADRQSDRTHLLDKNPAYSFHLPAIKHLLPNARFIHMIRDGRDVAASLVAASPTMGFGTARFVDGGKYWKEHVIGAREGAQFGADYLELRYEDFLGQQTALYRQVLEFCKLSADDAWISRMLEENTFEKMKERRATADPGVKASDAHYRKGKQGGWKEEYGARDAYEFNRVAGDLLCELGYAKPGWWAQSSTERLLVPAQWEWTRRRRILGLALTLARRGAFGSPLPHGFQHLDR